jgi:2-polyprenyl-3-methyl-5-hydroxy-6-metoxy-1,4-benzoquinol methylase
VSAGDGAAAAGACYVCRGPTATRRVAGNEVVVCTACGFGALTVQSVADYWERHDDLERELEDRYWTSARTAVFRSALARLAGRVEGRRLLDLGGGVGHFARCALDLGWDAYSVDVSTTATAAAASCLGDGRASTAVPASLAGAFDVVTLWCVAAHVTDPRRVLRDAVNALRPGGLLFLTTPNFRFQAGYARVLAAAGKSLDFAAHDHVVHFTPASLALLLADVGFEQATFTYVGVTEDCLLDRRMAGVLVPAKRLWNWTAVRAAGLGAPLMSSELHALAVVSAPKAATVAAR